MSKQSTAKKINDVALFHDSKGRVRIGIGVNDADQPGIHFYDEQGVNRMAITMGNEGVPIIVLKDDKGKENLALSGFLIRIGKIGEEHIQIDRAESKTAISFSGKKGSAFVGLMDGQPAVALSDAKDVNHVGMTANAKHASVSILRNDEYVWQAESEKGKARHE